MGASPLPGLTRVNLVRGVAGRSVSVGGGGARGALALAGSAEGTVLDCTASSASFRCFHFRDLGHQLRGPIAAIAVLHGSLP